LILKPLSIHDRLFFFERNFFTLDGLWMVETEKETNWEIALNIDLVVWKELLKIIFLRLKKYLNVKRENLIDFIRILTFRWSIEGWNYELAIIDRDNIEISIKNCPYYAAMDRNPDRHDKIPLICKDFCIALYESIINEFNRIGIIIVQIIKIHAFQMPISKAGIRDIYPHQLFIKSYYFFFLKYR